jgi:hypothetical protein
MGKRSVSTVKTSTTSQTQPFQHIHNHKIRIQALTFDTFQFLIDFVPSWEKFYLPLI